MRLGEPLLPPRALAGRLLRPLLRLLQAAQEVCHLLLGGVRLPFQLPPSLAPLGTVPFEERFAASLEALGLLLGVVALPLHRLEPAHQSRHVLGRLLPVRLELTSQGGLHFGAAPLRGGGLVLRGGGLLAEEALASSEGLQLLQGRLDTPRHGLLLRPQERLLALEPPHHPGAFQTARLLGLQGGVPRGLHLAELARQAHHLLPLRGADEVLQRQHLSLRLPPLPDAALDLGAQARELRLRVAGLVQVHREGARESLVAAPVFGLHLGGRGGEPVPERLLLPVQLPLQGLDLQAQGLRLRLRLGRGFLRVVRLVEGVALPGLERLQAGLSALQRVPHVGELGVRQDALLLERRGGLLERHGLFARAHQVALQAHVVLLQDLVLLLQGLGLGGEVLQVLLARGLQPRQLGRLVLRAPRDLLRLREPRLEAAQAAVAVDGSGRGRVRLGAGGLAVH